MKSEFHTFIIWHHALEHAESILQIIQATDNLNVKQAYSIEWSADLFTNNMSRFYGKNLPPNSNKVEHCGTGPFVLLILEDMKPEYGYRLTSKGFSYLNTKLFDLKSISREAIGGGHRIHCSNNLTESKHDVLLLLHKTLDELVNELDSNEWDGSVLPIDIGMKGESGWNSLKEVFQVLNECLTYVVLRNFDVLPNEFYSGKHGDIDLLVENYDDCCYLLNAKPVFQEDYRVHNAVQIAGEEVRFDFRFLGDSYYETLWESEILHSRVMHQNGFYIPEPVNLFYSLLYHALVHKRAIAKDYTEKLTDLSNTLGFDPLNTAFFSNAQNSFPMLMKYLNARGYKVTKPKDHSVYFNATLFQTSSNDITDITGILEGAMQTKPFYHKKNQYFESKTWKVKLPDNTDIALKRVKLLNEAAAPLLAREYKILQSLNHKGIVRTLLEGEIDGDYIIATHWIDGYNMQEGFGKFEQEFPTRTAKENFWSELKNIVDYLHQHNIKHRDMWEKNIMIADRKPVLIDFGWSCFIGEDVYTPPELREPDDLKAMEALRKKLLN